jgi:hypothetical protein
MPWGMAKEMIHYSQLAGTRYLTFKELVADNSQTEHDDMQSMNTDILLKSLLLPPKQL